MRNTDSATGCPFTTATRAEPKLAASLFAPSCEHAVTRDQRQRGDQQCACVILMTFAFALCESSGLRAMRPSAWMSVCISEPERSINHPMALDGPLAGRTDAREFALGNGRGHRAHRHGRRAVGCRRRSRAPRARTPLRGCAESTRRARRSRRTWSTGLISTSPNTPSSTYGSRADHASRALERFELGDDEAAGKTCRARLGAVDGGMRPGEHDAPLLDQRLKILQGAAA